MVHKGSSLGVGLQKEGIALRTALVFLCTALLTVIQSSAVLAQASPEATVYIDRAVLAYEAKRFNEALKELEEALRLNPESVQALYYRGLVFVALNRPADARAALEKARTLRAEDVDVAFQLGVLYFNQKEYEKAEPLLQQVHRAEPSRPNLGYYLGFMEYRKKNYRTAIEFFRESVPSDETFAQLTRFYTALATSALGFFQQARADIEEALRLQPVSPLVTPSRRFREALERKAKEERFFRGELRLSVFFDSNVAVVPNSSSDPVAQALREERSKSEGELVDLNLSYTWLRTLDWEGTISHRFFQTYNNRLTNFNIQSHTPTIGIVNRGSVPSPLGDLPYFAGLQYTYDFLTLGNARFTQRWIMSPYFTLQENARNLTNLQFRFQVKDFFNDGDVIRSEVRDAVNYLIGPTHFLFFEQGRLLVKLGYQYDYEASEGKNFTYWGNRVLAGVQYTLPWWDVQLSYDLDFHWRFHKHRHSLLPTGSAFTKKRRDREGVHLVSIAKDFSTDFSRFLPFVSCPPGRCPFTISVGYLFDRNRSNLASFDYRRYVLTTSLTWRF
ncbi:MAG: tetratricopeptide repeat protein [Candidatus Binatia bacterium]